MKVELSKVENGAVIKMVGEMMLGYAAADFHEAVLNAMDGNNKNIVVDLSEVQFITSWGIGMLMYGHTTAINGEGTFKLAAVPQDIKDVLVKVKLDNIFEQYDSVKEALNS